MGILVGNRNVSAFELPIVGLHDMGAAERANTSTHALNDRTSQLNE